MKFVLCLFLCFCVFQTNAKTFDLLNKIKTGLVQTGQGIKCGFHKVGSTVVKHEHENDPCHTHSSGGVNDVRDENKKPEENDSTTQPSIDVRYNGEATTEDAVVTVPFDGGKRILGVKANCPEGQAADSRGRCRERY